MQLFRWTGGGVYWNAITIDFSGKALHNCTSYRKSNYLIISGNVKMEPLVTYVFNECSIGIFHTQFCTDSKESRYQIICFQDAMLMKLNVQHNFYILRLQI